MFQMFSMLKHLVLLEYFQLATDETLVGDVMFDQNLDRKKFSIRDWVLVK